MKRHKHPINRDDITLFEAICDYENIVHAYKNARKGKSWYSEVREIDKNPEPYLKALQKNLINKTYKTSEYDVFERKEGKKLRKIYKLPFYPNRVAQWAIIQIIEPIWLRYFTNDTYSAIPGKGIHLALKRLKSILKHDDFNTEYCLKMDVRKYYQSIDHNILKDKLHNLFKDNDLLDLLFEIIDSVPDNEGVPIGNYLSQYFGNFYLSDLDHWLKEEQRVKYYFRYMDDMIILGNSKTILHNLRKEIDFYLKWNLNLTLKENWQVFPTRTRGIDFVGYRCFGNYTLLRKGTYKDFKVKMLKIKNKQTLSEHDKGVVASYRGWIKHCNGYRLWKKYEPRACASKSV